jgi:hypothetical protein
MTIAQHLLTPSSDQTPVTVEIPTKQLSGALWVSKFPTSTRLDEMNSAFATSVASFLSALKAAGASVDISATLRPAKRAFLMHWAWKIVNADADPLTIPECEGVDIQWGHLNEKGDYCREKSVAAATAMVNGYGMRNLRVAPALTSRHIEGKAIDMTINWTGTLSIRDAMGRTVDISTEPKTGMNADLHAVGATYMVIKFKGGDKDKPHWSTDGR